MKTKNPCLFAVFLSSLTSGPSFAMEFGVRHRGATYGAQSASYSEKQEGKQFAYLAVSGTLIPVAKLFRSSYLLEHFLSSDIQASLDYSKLLESLPKRTICPNGIETLQGPYNQIRGIKLGAGETTQYESKYLNNSYCDECWKVWPKEFYLQRSGVGRYACDGGIVMQTYPDGEKPTDWGSTTLKMSGLKNFIKEHAANLKMSVPAESETMEFAIGTVWQALEEGDASEFVTPLILSKESYVYLKMQLNNPEVRKKLKIVFPFVDSKGKSLFQMVITDRRGHPGFLDADKKFIPYTEDVKLTCDMMPYTFLDPENDPYKSSEVDW